MKHTNKFKLVYFSWNSLVKVLIGLSAIISVAFFEGVLLTCIVSNSYRLLLSVILIALSTLIAFLLPPSLKTHLYVVLKYFSSRKKKGALLENDANLQLHGQVVLKKSSKPFVLVRREDVFKEIGLSQIFSYSRDAMDTNKYKITDYLIPELKRRHKTFLKKIKSMYIIFNVEFMGEIDGQNSTGEYYSDFTIEIKKSNKLKFLKNDLMEFGDFLNNFFHKFGEFKPQGIEQYLSAYLNGHFLRAHQPDIDTKKLREISEKLSDPQVKDLQSHKHFIVPSKTTVYFQTEIPNEADSRKDPEKLIEIVHFLLATYYL